MKDMAALAGALCALRTLCCAVLRPAPRLLRLACLASFLFNRPPFRLHSSPSLLQTAAGGSGVAALEGALRPVERYAVRFIEVEAPQVDKDALAAQVRGTY